MSFVRDAALLIGPTGFGLLVLLRLSAAFVTGDPLIFDSRTPACPGRPRPGSADKAWMPRSCRSSDVDGASMSYARSRAEGGRGRLGAAVEDKRITGHESHRQPQEHQQSKNRSAR